MGQVRRLQDWPIRLSRLLKERAASPFMWGINDCLIFAADAYHTITGVDLAEGWRGQYTTEAEAIDYLKAQGGIAAVISEHMGIEGVRYQGAASRGDIVTVRHQGAVAAGVIDDTGIRVAVLCPEGLARIPLNHIHRIWSY